MVSIWVQVKKRQPTPFFPKRLTAPLILDVPATVCLNSRFGFCERFPPSERRRVPNTRQPARLERFPRPAPGMRTRRAACFEALALKVNWKSKDLNLLFGMQLPAKFHPSLRIP